MRVQTEYSRELDEKRNGTPRVSNVQSWNNQSIKKWINIFGRETKVDMIPRKAQSFEIKQIRNMCEETKYRNKEEQKQEEEEEEEEKEGNQRICQITSLNKLVGKDKKADKNENRESSIINNKESLFNSEEKNEIDEQEEWYHLYNRKPKKGVTKIILYNQLRCFDNLINIQKRVPCWGNYKENFLFHSKRIMDLQFNEIKLYSIILRCTDIKNIENSNVYVLRDIINELDEFRKFYEPDFEPLVLSEMHLQEREKKNTTIIGYDINCNDSEFITHATDNLVQPIIDYNVMHRMKELNCQLNNNNKYKAIHESTIPNTNYPLNDNNNIFIVSAVEIPEEVFNMYCGKESNKKNTPDVSNKKDIHMNNNNNNNNNSSNNNTSNNYNYNNNTLNGAILKENINLHTEEIKNVEHTMNARNVHTKIREKRRNKNNNNNNSNNNININNTIINNTNNNNNNSNTNNNNNNNINNSNNNNNINNNDNNINNNNNQKGKRKRNKSVTNKTGSKKRTGFYALEVDGVIASFEARKGVYYDKSRKLWRANWKENGRIQTKGFSVNEYKSVQLARQKAIEWREKKEAELLL